MLGGNLKVKFKNLFRKEFLQNKHIFDFFRKRFKTLFGFKFYSLFPSYLFPSLAKAFINASTSNVYKAEN